MELREYIIYTKEDLDEWSENGFIYNMPQGFSLKLDGDIPVASTFEFLGDFGEDEGLKEVKTTAELWEFLDIVIRRIKRGKYDDEPGPEDPKKYIGVFEEYKDYCLELMGKAA